MISKALKLSKLLLAVLWKLCIQTALLRLRGKLNTLVWRKFNIYV